VSVDNAPDDSAQSTDDTLVDNRTVTGDPNPEPIYVKPDPTPATPDPDFTAPSLSDPGTVNAPADASEPQETVMEPDDGSSTDNTPPDSQREGEDHVEDEEPPDGPVEEGE
jgi:hypothetical protein